MIFKNDKFKLIRKQNRWSLASLSRKSKISRKSLTLWENGQRTPSEKNIRILSDSLGIPVSHISDIPPDQNISKKDISKSANLWLELSQTTKQDATYRNLINNATILNTKLEQASVIIKGLLTSLHSIFYIKDVNLKYMVVNNSFLKNVSLNSAYDVIGKADSDFFSIKEAKLNNEQDKGVLQTGVALKNSEQYIPGTRKKKWGIISKLPITDIDNKTIGIVGIFLDITEKKENEKIKTLLEIHIEAMNASVTISHANFSKYLYVNKGHEKIYGYPNETFYRETQNFWLNNCIHPDDREREKEFIRKKNWPSKYEFRILKPEGQIRWIESQVSKNITYQNQECIIAIDSDITERKKASIKRIMLENAINNIDDGIIISETERPNQLIKPNVKYINKALKNILGIADIEFLNDFSIYSLATLVKYNEIKTKLINPKFPLTLEYDIIKNDKNERITISEEIFNYSEGMYLSIIRDITSQIKEKEIRDLLEESLKDSNDVLWMREHGTNKLVYVSESVTKLTGYPILSFEKEIKFWQKNCVHPDDQAAYRKNLINDVWPRTLRYRIIDTSGKIKWIQTIIFYKSKNDKIYRAVDRDITKQINAEQEKQNKIRLEIANNLLKHNIDPKIIADSTKLTNEQVNSLI